jgi:hypothetical protein
MNVQASAHLRVACTADDVLLIQLLVDYSTHSLRTALRRDRQRLCPPAHDKPNIKCLSGPISVPHKSELAGRGTGTIFINGAQLVNVGEVRGSKPERLPLGCCGLLYISGAAWTSLAMQSIGRLTAPAACRARGQKQSNYVSPYYTGYLAPTFLGT